MIEVLPVLGETATATEPADGAFDDPAFGEDDEPFDLIATSDDFGHQIGHGVRQTIVEDRPGIGAVGKQPREEREPSEQGGEHDEAAIAVLNVSSGDQRMQQQAERIDENVALLAFDQLGAVEAVGIDARPPFSALFTLWLSTIQAVGLASRSANSRHLT